MLTPNQLFQALADAITDTVKRPFREEPITPNEWAEIQARFDTLAAMNGYTEGDHERRDKSAA